MRSKYYTYRGWQYRLTPFAYYEIYHLDRFKSFDTIEGLEAFIDEYEAEISY